MKKFIKYSILLSSAIGVTSITPMLVSCGSATKVTKLEAIIKYEYFVGEQIKKEDFVVTATLKNGQRQLVTDWQCDVTLPYTFADTQPKTFVIKYAGLETKVTKNAQEPMKRITLRFITDGHGTVDKAQISTQAPVRWSAAPKPIVTPDSGYMFDKWADENGIEIPKDKRITSDTTIKVLFKEQPATEKGLKFVHQRLAGVEFFSVEWDGSDSISPNLVIPSKHRYEKDGKEYPVLWVRNFKNCKYIKSVTIPSCVNSIGTEAFAYDSQTDHSILESVTFGENSQCEEINSSAFKGCEKLTGITIPKSVTKIGASAFEMGLTTVFTNLKFEEGSKIKTISEDAFKNCEQLFSVDLPEGLTSLGGFNGTSINTITIPDSVTEITAKCFYTEKLTTINFKTNTHLTAIGDSAFRTSKITKFELPDSVTRIGGHAFEDCSELDSFGIGDNSKLVNLGASGGLVFSGTKIKSFTIPATVTTIGHTLFGKKESAQIQLTSLTFKDTEHTWRIGYGTPEQTFKPSGEPEQDAPNFVSQNDGAMWNKKTS